MSKANSTATRKPKQTKLSYHPATRYWYKTTKGKRYYLFRIDDDPEGEKSLAEWLRIQDDPEGLKTGKDGSLSLHELCNRFMSFKESRKRSGELSQRMYDEYMSVCETLLAELGKGTSVNSITPNALARVRERWSVQFGVNGLNKRVTQARCLFKFAYDEGMLEKPIRYGQSFSKPSSKTIRKHRMERGRLDFSREEISGLLDKANPTQKAMVLLGINCALGNSDIADLEHEHLDLRHGILNYDRNKTATPRRCPLWKETVDALSAAIATRPASQAKVFISKNGQDYTDESRTGWRITGEFRQVCNRAKVIQDGRGFYSLRRTFQTQAEACRDLPAIRLIMGHTDAASDMSARYRQHIDDERLLAATNAVREWLFGKPANAKRGGK
jgi:integrase